jgi:amino acid permease
MNSAKTGMIAAAIVGVLFLIVAVIYFLEPASALPGFLPGHEAGVDKPHIKHGVLALALAVICFVVAWFQSGPKPGSQSL